VSNSTVTQRVQYFRRLLYGVDAILCNLYCVDSARLSEVERVSERSSVSHESCETLSI
jgi:hypothetical protein